MESLFIQLSDDVEISISKNWHLWLVLWSGVTNVILILYNNSINEKLILRDLRFRQHIGYFLLFFANKNISKQPQHCFASLNNTTVFRSWMNQPFKWFGSIAIIYSTHLLRKTCCHHTGGFNFTFKFFFIFYNFKYCIQRFRMKISKHDLCIFNCRLNAFMFCTK